MNAPMSVGAELKAARRRKNWSVERAAHATKLRPGIISSIEQDRYDLLPNPAYAKGFVRIYARELGLDPFPILKKLSGEIPEAEDDTELDPEALEAIPPRREEHGKGVQTFGFAIVVCITILGAVIGGVQMYRIWSRISDANKNRPLFEQANGVSVLPPSASLKPVKEDKPTPVVKEADEEKEEVRRAEIIAAPKQNEEENTDELPVRRAEPVEGQDIILRAEPVENPTPAPDLAATGNRLRLLVHEACRVQVIGISNNHRQVLFDDVIPAGETIPDLSAAAWASDAFELTLEKAEQVDVIYNDTNFGHYHQTGLQTFHVPDVWISP